MVGSYAAIVQLIQAQGNVSPEENQFYIEDMQDSISDMCASVFLDLKGTSELSTRVIPPHL